MHTPFHKRSKKEKKKTMNVSNQGSEGPLYEYFQPLKEELEKD